MADVSEIQHSLFSNSTVWRSWFSLTERWMIHLYDACARKQVAGWGWEVVEGISRVAAVGAGWVVVVV